jgi:hypothetical protein
MHSYYSPNAELSDSRPQRGDSNFHDRQRGS